MVLETKGLLASADPEDRRRGVEAMVRLGDTALVSVLPGALGDADWRVRKEAVAIAKLLEPSSRLIEAVADLLARDDNVGLRNAAVEVLANWGGSAVDALTNEASKLDEDGRKLVAEALGKTGHSGAFPVLRGMLSDQDTNVRLAALEGIAALGVVCPDDAAEALKQRLREGDELEKLTALDGINQLGIIVEFEHIEGLLQDRVLRQAAWLAAGRCREPRVAPRLVAALDGALGSAWRWALAAVASSVEKSESMAKAARSALLMLRPETTERLFDAATRSEFLDERRRAITVLSALGSPRAVRVVFSVLADEELSEFAEQAFERLGPDACEPLLDTYRDLDDSERGVALRLCGRVAPGVLLPRVREAVLEALDSETPELVLGALECTAAASDADCVAPTARWLDRTDDVMLRKAASSALEAMASRHFETARALARVAVPEGTTALSAVTIIGSALTPVFDSRDEDVRFLANAVSNSDPVVRRAALAALAAAGDAAGLEAVSFALADEVGEVRIAAARALGKLRDSRGLPVGLPILIEALESCSDEDVMIAAIKALGDTAVPEALERLRPLVRSSAPLVAVAALEAIAESFEDGREESLLDGLGHVHVEVVKSALKALGGYVSMRAIDRVGQCLEHGAWDVRRAAADWLGRFGGPKSAARLRVRLAIEREPLVRDAIQRALGGGDVVHVVRRQTPIPGVGSWPPR